MDFRLKLALVPLLLGGVLLLDSAAAEAETVTLEGAVSAALAAIQARADALTTIPSQLETLPDLRLMVNLVNISLDNPSFNREGMTQLQMGISQMLLGTEGDGIVAILPVEKLYRVRTRSEVTANEI